MQNHEYDVNDWIDCFEYGVASFSDLPASLQEDVPFLAEAVACALEPRQFYDKLPTHLKREREICTAVIPWVPDDDLGTIEFIFSEAAPTIAACPLFWDAVFDGYEPEEIFRRYAPLTIRRNLDFMMKVNCEYGCGRDLWALTNPSLRDNPNFVAKIRLAPDDYYGKYPAVYYELVRLSPPIIREDLEIAKMVLNADYNTYAFFSDRVQRNEEIVNMLIDWGCGSTVLAELPANFVRESWLQGAN